MEIEFEFQPEQPGAYRVQLFTQGTTKFCAVDEFEVHITDNTPYSPTPPLVNAAQEVMFRDVVRGSYHLPAIGAFEAQERGKGEGVLIAIIDSGINYNHPDLWPNMWQNTDEIPDNGQDDDLNGYIDDTVGWDFLYDDAHPKDDKGHGSLVASFAAARGYGVAPRAQLMALKATGYNRGGVETISEAIRYAVDNEADIINISLSTPRREEYDYQIHPLLRSALLYAHKKGVIVVAAAGNQTRQNLDRIPSYPAAFTEGHVVAVAATRLNGYLTRYTNIGPKTVTLAAPGGNHEYSYAGEFYEEAYLMRGAHYWPQSRVHRSSFGTSIAGPIVAGAFAVMKSIDTEASSEALIKSLMLSGTTSYRRYLLPVRSGKMLNLADAVRILTQEPLPTVSLDLPPAIELLPISHSR